MRANNLTLLTDLYELTMMQGYFKNPTDQTVVFDMFYRDNPCGGGFAICAGLCKMVAPILEELAEEYAGKIDIYKVDTEKEEGLAASFGIRSIPSLLFCPMNGQPQMAKGAMGKADFKKAINEVLLKKE